MLQIRLQHNDRVIHEICASDLAQEIEIGRSSACGWRVPVEDTVSSSHHAVLTRQGKDVVLLDKQSKNGTWFCGRRIEQKKLKTGDRITMGRCVLVVEEVSKKTSGAMPAEIVVLTGKLRNQHKPIQGAQFTIGSDPKADLLFLDDLVSREHAVILHKEDGSYWLKDNGSTNGTKVNDVPLRAQQERLLKDGDRVAIAHMEFIFRDGAGPRDQGQALLKLGIVMALVLLVSGLYLVFQFVKPSAGKRIQNATQMAQQGRFLDARGELDKAINGRGYGDAQEQVMFVRRQIDCWESAFKQWQKSRGYLEGQNWKLAATELGGLLSLSSDSFGWGEGPLLRQNAEKLKRLLDIYLDVSRPDIALSDLTAKYEALKAVIREIESQKELGGLRALAGQRLTALNEQIITYRRLDDALKNLQIWQPPPDVGQAVSEVEAIAQSSDGALKQRAEIVLQPLRRLADAYGRLHTAVGLICSMQMREVATSGLDLPTPDECVIDNRLTILRANIEGAYANLKQQGGTAEVMVTALSNQVDSVTTVPLALRFWMDSANMEKIFACDSLNGPFPRRTRMEPQGEYDRAVCVELFYTGLRSLADQRSDDYATTTFEPILITSAHVVAAAKKYAEYFADPQHQWLKRGELERWDQCARRILETRDRLVADLLKTVRQSSGRKAVIAVGIAWRFMDNPEKEKIENQVFLREWLATKFRDVRQEVLSLKDKLESAEIVEKIKLRNQILMIGLPGDPVVQEMWQARASSGGE